MLIVMKLRGNIHILSEKCDKERVSGMARNEKCESNLSFEWLTASFLIFYQQGNICRSIAYALGRKIGKTNNSKIDDLSNVIQPNHNFMFPLIFDLFLVMNIMTCHRKIFCLYLLPSLPTRLFFLRKLIFFLLRYISNI